MSNKENLDFSTLTWVKSELDETLNRAKEALMAYVEETEDSNQLQFCITYLHQIQGTLKMVELYGAAMVAEEMEAVAKALLDGDIDDVDAAFDVLMRSILQLPDYLERIELGHKDVPIVLLPLVNDLRAVRSQRLLSESALFNPDLDLAVPDHVSSQNIALQGNQLKTALMKIRSAYQMALLNWIKQDESERALLQLQQVLSKLRMILAPSYLKQLFWVYGGLLQGLAEGRVKDSISIKSLAAKIDMFIKELSNQDSQIKSTSRALTRNFLYYIAISETGSAKVDEIKSFFNLDRFIPDETDIKHAKGSLTGKNKELLQTVSAAINDDVLVVQESLDLFIRNKSAKADELEPLLGNLQKIADTLGILGLGIARDNVVNHQNELKKAVDDQTRPKDNELLEIAQTLLRIESELADHIQSLGLTDDSDVRDDQTIPQSERRAIVQQLAKESIVNLQQIKANFVAFIEAPWDKHQVQDNPQLLKEIAGALNILQLDQAGEHIQHIIDYVNKEILTKSAKPSASELEQLATVVSSIEYYLENLDQGQRIQDNLITEVGKQIVLLQNRVAADDRETEPAAEDTDESISQTTEPQEHLEVEPEEVQEVDQEEAEKVTETAEPESQEQVTSVTKDKTQSDPSKYVLFGDDADDFIKEVFLEEFEEEPPNLQQQFAEWLPDPDNKEHNLSEMRRIFHTLKGSGRLVGAEAVGEFGWKLENMCNRTLDGAIVVNDNFKTVLADGIQLAEQLLTALKTGLMVPDIYPVVLQNADNVAAGSEHLISLEVIEATAADEETSTVETVLESEAEDLTSKSVVTEDALSDELATEDPAPEDAIEEAISEEDIDDIDKPIEYHPPSRDEWTTDTDSADLDSLSETLAGSQQQDTLSQDELPTLEEIDGLDFDSEDEEDIIQFSDSLETDEEHEDDLDELADLSELEAQLAAFDDESDDGLLSDQADDDITEVAGDEDSELEIAEDLLNLDDVDDEDFEDDLEHDAAFIQILQKEVSGHLDDMAEQLSRYQNGSAKTVNDDFVRTVHTLNGAASMANVNAITSMTTPLEKLALQLHDQNEAFIDEDLAHIESLIAHTRGQIQQLGAGQIPADDEIGEYFNARLEQLIDANGSDHGVEDRLYEETLPESDVSDDLEDVDLEDDDLEDDDLEDDDLEDDDLEDDDLEDDDLEDDDFEDDDFEDDDFEDDDFEDDDFEDDDFEDDDFEDDEFKDDEFEEVELEEVELEEVELEEAELEEAELEDTELEDTDKVEGKTKEPEVVKSEANYAAYQTSDAVNQDQSDLEIDEELLEIFAEEASEIFDRAEHLMAELEDSPEAVEPVLGLQRDLHTLKGGARMAGLNQIGDLSHQLESLLETIAGKQSEVTPNQYKVISKSLDQLLEMVKSDNFGQLTSIEEMSNEIEALLTSEGRTVEAESELDQTFFDPLNQADELDDIEEDVVSDTPKREAKKANVLSGGQIKVNSELLDKLVNFAGEVSIYRSRMEQQSAELKLNIDELENTVERVRRQLRDLEHETEAQIISNYQIQGDELEEDFDPLELDQFSTMQQLSRSLSESVSDLTNIQNYLKESVRSSETLLIQQSRVNTELQEGLMETRLVTFNSLVPRLRRVLRTAAQELGKQAKLVVHGSEGEMDKTVLEGIQAPLEHMIRNAVVHGLESDRKAVSKSEQGQIEIDISREATEVVITVEDDGAGIDLKAVKAKALKKGLISADHNYNDSEIAQLVTHSGLSAADTVTKLAGRGVGMDVVNNEIKRLGGSLEISSKSGKGTIFTIRLPYTLALTQALIVQVADHRYAIPASGVEGLVRMNVEEFKRRVDENDLMYDYAGEQYHIQELNKLLNVDSDIMADGDQVPLVMIKSGDQGVALRVDQTFGGREIVVKSVGIQVASVPGIFGATILGDGAVVLILDIIPMHRGYVHKLERMIAEGIEVEEVQDEEIATTIMVVDDSITMRRAGERILTRNDFEVMTAKDGLDALNKLQEQVPDLMLLDIEMPRMDGYELATAMKQSDKFKHIPIIMITSRTGQKHKDRAKAIGVERYLGKPYQELELLENIKELLNLEDA